MRNLIELAIGFAAFKHTGQVRKGTSIPYISHPFAVGMMLQQAGESEEVIAAGILHDTLEDTATTEEEIRTVFGEQVLLLVKAASEPDKSRPWEDRKRHTVSSWLPARGKSLPLSLRTNCTICVPSAWISRKLERKCGTALTGARNNKNGITGEL
nr:HD domain-containing protein [Planococcus glaciei]